LVETKKASVGAGTTDPEHYASPYLRVSDVAAAQNNTLRNQGLHTTDAFAAPKNQLLRRDDLSPRAVAALSGGLPRHTLMLPDVGTTGLGQPGPARSIYSITMGRNRMFGPFKSLEEEESHRFEQPYLNGFQPVQAHDALLNLPLSESPQESPELEFIERRDNRDLYLVSRQGEAIALLEMPFGGEEAYIWIEYYSADDDKYKYLGWYGPYDTCPESEFDKGPATLRKVSGCLLVNEFFPKGNLDKRLQAISGYPWEFSKPTFSNLMTHQESAQASPYASIFIYEADTTTKFRRSLNVLVDIPHGKAEHLKNNRDGIWILKPSDITVKIHKNRPHPGPDQLKELLTIFVDSMANEKLSTGPWDIMKTDGILVRNIIDALRRGIAMAERSVPQAT